MNFERYQSWGRYPKVQQQVVKALWRHEPLPLHGLSGRSVLPFGNGRSYGDVCLNDDGVLIDTRPLDRFIHFDAATGILRCEAGVLLSEILQLITPKGWFLPVTPGTKFVTVGGAIANDVHGKNHHRAGTFGCHVRCFELRRSDGRSMYCSPEENVDWFRATIGGLGLTGLITWAEMQLKPIANPYVEVETIRYSDLEGFFQLSAESDGAFEYTVAWVDCLAGGARLGRGLFVRGNHAARVDRGSDKRPGLQLTIPFDPPFSLVNRWTVEFFNKLYYRRQMRGRTTNTIHYEPFFYPLDGILKWNRIYGPAGFLQYQCVVPLEHGRHAIKEILERIARSRLGSFLAVLKLFGGRVSPGLLSFPRRGVTLALDFANHREKTFALLDQLDEVVTAVQGAVYPAKDARMSADSFQIYLPVHEKLKQYIDPKFSSSFWRRVQRKKT